MWLASILIFTLAWTDGYRIFCFKTSDEKLAKYRDSSLIKWAVEGGSGLEIYEE